MGKEVKSDGCTEGKVYCPSKKGDLEYFGAKEIVGVELDYIRKRRKDRGLADETELQTRNLCGLALSGGGIRSASFSLGVMQALAHNRWLSEIDYLSTVSGGGYIGSSLTWVLNSDPGAFGLQRDNFPFASFPMTSEARDGEGQKSLEEELRKRTEKSKWSGRLLRFVRQNAKYLTPGKGLNLFTLAWVGLRAAALGLLVYGALAALFFLFAFQTNFLLHEICAFSFLPKAFRQNGFILLATFGFGLWAVTVPLYSLATYMYQRILRDKTYRMRRQYEKWAGKTLPWLLVVLLLGLVPLAHNWVAAKGTVPTTKEGKFAVSGNLTQDGGLSFKGTVKSSVAATSEANPSRPLPCTSPCAEEQPPDPRSLGVNIWGEMKRVWAGLAAILVGLASAVTAFFKTKSIKPGRIPLGLLVGVGVGALLFGVILFAYTLAYAVVGTIGCNNPATWRFIWIGGTVTLFFAIVTNINHISIHRYYRDRLMETFLPNIDRDEEDEYRPVSGNDRANTRPLHEMTSGPYHIINANVVLVSSDKPKFKVRGGDNFILSPGYCGSYATGWRCTHDFVDGAMTLASAMAISGAALNPSAGCGGEGITRSPFLSVLMGLLNFRLGCWVPNPDPGIAVVKVKNPNFLLPGIWEVAFRYLLNEKGTFLQLSDGGHFENLGLYELVRRKLRLIIVCDGGADPKFAFSDLANAMEKVRTDFGALIMIDNTDLGVLIPEKANREGDGDDVPVARQGHLVATIKYADGSIGTLIYLTTTLFKGATADLYGYKKENPAFPDEPTVDQFFDEKQFEAYRELGFQAAWRMMRDPKAVTWAWPEGSSPQG